MADIVNSTLAPYRSEELTRILIDGPHLSVSREPATTLALCLHEFATNAIKYGALSSPEGHVLLNWELSAGADPDLTIRWIETGGPAVVAPSRTGYGTRYIRAALTGLFGRPPELVFDAAGLQCIVSGPLSRLLPNH
ncbi:hypothetical protein GCM10010994_14090 [Chelatococcus reniformis]|uniref:histidine kinase n=1 Tax=Chelatococcus reniformis TaxID=1494448 RepID=A0A916U125_9HYPH|nr:hypothetical protein GCM10010994_14090 [Chelatococcus reniformis]